MKILSLCSRESLDYFRIPSKMDTFPTHKRRWAWCIIVLFFVVCFPRFRSVFVWFIKPSLQHVIEWFLDFETHLYFKNIKLIRSFQVCFHQELLVLLWKCCEYNQKFLMYVLKTSDVLELLVPILYHICDARNDQCEQFMNTLFTYVSRDVKNPINTVVFYSNSKEDNTKQI